MQLKWKKFNIYTKLNPLWIWPLQGHWMSFCEQGRGIRSQFLGGHFVCACSEAPWLLSSDGFLSASFHPLYPWDKSRRKVGGLSSSSVSAVNRTSGRTLNPQCPQAESQLLFRTPLSLLSLGNILEVSSSGGPDAETRLWCPHGLPPDISVKFPSTQILNPLIEGLSIKYNVNKTSALSVELAGLLTATETVCYIAGVFVRKSVESKVIFCCEFIRCPVLHGMTILRS